jgi:two-component system chemotaxis response regulator CheB
VVAIGASTGGTEALAAVLARLPVDSPPVVIVQHMPAAFTGPFAARLDGLSAVRVTEAADGERLRAGCALLARGDTHLIVRRAGSGWVARYTHQEPVNRHCPSVDVLFDAVAAAAGVQAVGILLTGMGADGARGLLRLRQAGAVTIAQNENSCVVYGMPKQAVALGAAQYTAAPEEIPGLVLCALRARGHGCEKAVARHE